jgi:hypothetical protein
MRACARITFHSVCISFPLKPNLVQVIFKNPVRTAKKIQHFTIAKINWLTLFKEIIPVYSKIHTRPTIQKTQLLVVKVGGISSFHQDLEGLM